MVYVNLLNNLFNDMREEGYIYDQDENGQGMSYGEFFAINTAFEEILCDEILHIHDLEEAAETLREIMGNTSDDVRVFFNAEEYDDFDCYIDEDKKTVELCSVPQLLKAHFEELVEEYKDMNDFEYAA